MFDFITGEKFISIGEMIYSPGHRHDANKVKNTFDTKRLKPVNLVYCHTMYLSELFYTISQLDEKFIVVCHNCDEAVNDEIHIPMNVKRLYTTNVATMDPRVESIPIGLENEKWFPDLRKKDRMILKLREPREIKNLVYVNFNIATNYTSRIKAYNSLHIPSATIEMGTNGNGFDRYIDNIYNHHFVACPMGNGIDTHRTWETLYMGSIPIEKRNWNNRFYKDLPICFVDDWDEVTENFLLKELDRIKSKNWSYEKLNFTFWKNRILTYANN